MKLRGYFLVLMGLLLASAGCGSVSSRSAEVDEELLVFAAASLAEAFTDLARQFETVNPGSKVLVNFAGSQQLAHQLSQGAPADVFASADTQQMKAAIDAGRVAVGSQETFARNQLVVVVPADNPAGVQSISDLALPGLRLVLAAAEVPAGHYALTFLDNANADPAFGSSFRSGVLANVVSYEENVRAVLSKVQLGEADSGIVYFSDVVGAGSEKISYLQIPDDLNAAADYLIAPVGNSPQPDLGRAFIDFILSPLGQKVLAEHGLTPVIPLE